MDPSISTSSKVFAKQKRVEVHKIKVETIFHSLDTTGLWKFSSPWKLRNTTIPPSSYKILKKYNWSFSWKNIIQNIM